MRAPGWRGFTAMFARGSRPFPRVASVVISRMALISHGGDRTTIQVPGYVPPPGESARTSLVVGSEGYLAAMGIPLWLGPDISTRDTAAAPPVAVVNETFVRKYLGGANPVGRTLARTRRPAYQTQGSLPARRFDITAGVLSDVLAAFEKVSGLSVTVSTGGIREIASPGVRGVYPVEQALQKVLADTGVTYRFTSATAVIIELKA
jgi:secretin/TonB-like protein